MKQYLIIYQGNNIYCKSTVTNSIAKETKSVAKVMNSISKSVYVLTLGKYIITLQQQYLLRYNKSVTYRMNPFIVMLA